MRDILSTSGCFYLKLHLGVSMYMYRGDIDFARVIHTIHSHHPDMTSKVQSPQGTLEHSAKMLHFLSLLSKFGIRDIGKPRFI